MLSELQLFILEHVIHEMRLFLLVVKDFFLLIRPQILSC